MLETIDYFEARILEKYVVEVGDPKLLHTQSGLNFSILKNVL